MNALFIWNEGKDILDFGVIERFKISTKEGLENLFLIKRKVRSSVKISKIIK